MVKTELTAKERVEQEQFELVEKTQKLTSFLFSDKGRKLEEEARNLLIRQVAAMQDYANILNERLLIWKD